MIKPVRTSELEPGDLAHYGRHYISVEGTVEGHSVNSAGQPLTLVFGYANGVMRELYELPDKEWLVQRSKGRGDASA